MLHYDGYHYALNTQCELFYSVCERSRFFKARFLKKYFYNSRIGKSSLLFYNFGMKLLPNIILVLLESPLKLGNLVCISQNVKVGGHSSLRWSGSHN